MRPNVRLSTQTRYSVRAMFGYSFFMSQREVAHAHVIYIVICLLYNAWFLFCVAPQIVLHATPAFVCLTWAKENGDSAR